MPEIARFFGIIIKMYSLGKEHNPPHVHAQYRDNAAEFDINTGEILSGFLPDKAKSLVTEWIGIHTHEEEIWESQIFRRLPPLE